ncbi:uncharacterized protein LOC122312634 [Carya illinoinensis]|uniref:uncharacterized protein LOC122312634 n=1 Tax=Carya illinoinensis TaxID=32201 RepID=UPI001C725D57|nr:uncharacterized protein LOC122312634 [Carya illinoinensis]
MDGDRKGQCSSLNHNSKTWRKMWSLQAPQATKSFLWRAAKESLPTCLNLYKRKMVDSPLCPVCHRVPESVTHAIWSCSAAQDVWSMSTKRIQKLNVEDGPFVEVLKPLLENLSSHELTEVAVTARAIWNKRNQWLFEQSFHSPFQVVNILEWTAPPSSFYKANWDVAVDKGKSRIGVGVIVRDSSGMVMASMCSSMLLDPDPLLGEAVAALKASTLCSNIGLDQVMLEGDSLAVVQAVQSREECWSPTGLVIRDIKLVLSRICTWSIHHISRRLNVVAHVLAKFALTCSGEHTFMEDYPPCIRNLL